MKNVFASMLSVLMLAGCQKPEPAAAPSDPDIGPNGIPTHAQPMLRTMKLYLGSEVLDAELALTEKEERIGMMYRTNIPETDAMLFDLYIPQRASFWMTNCPESLSAAYINPDGVIEEIHHLEKNDNVPVVADHDNIQYVLETKDGWFDRHHISAGMVIQTEKGSLAETFSSARP